MTAAVGDRALQTSARRGCREDMKHGIFIDSNADIREGTERKQDKVRTTNYLLARIYFD